MIRNRWKRRHHLLDEWLAGLPHETKFVIRGNHDQYKITFPLSRAQYAVRPEIHEVHGLRCGMSPFGLGKRAVTVPDGCDVLVSHYPPFNILDRCCNDKPGGSSQLRKSVERLRIPPALWLFGHIHEGRGSTKVEFKSDRKGQQATETSERYRSTLCLNVANANDGPARRVVRPATVIDVTYFGVEPASEAAET